MIVIYANFIRASIFSDFDFRSFSLAQLGQEVYQELYHNNHYVMTIYGLAADAFCDDGNSVILHLKENDQLTVKAYNDNYLYGTDTAIYSTLSGVMLFDEETMHSNGRPQNFSVSCKFCFYIFTHKKHV